MDRLRTAPERVMAALLAACKTPERCLSTFSISFILFFIFAFNTNIPWNIDLLSSSIFNAGEVLLNGYSSFLVDGKLRLLLVVLYSLLIGAAVTNLTLLLSEKKLNKKSLASILPGFVAGGCGCGIGLLGLIGLGGATLALPFQGQLVVLAGIILVLYALYDMGNPEICDVKVNVGS